MLLWQQAHYGFWIFEPMSSNLIFGLGFKQANSGRTFLPSLAICSQLSLSFKLHTIQTTEARKVRSSKRASHVTPFDASVSFGHEASLNPDKFSQFWFSITFIFPPIDPLSLSLSIILIWQITSRFSLEYPLSPIFRLSPKYPKPSLSFRWTHHFVVKSRS